MHDDALERRLGEVLHDEAASLPFTITPAELERRLALRRRGLAGRRLTLLLAAAVGISLFGVGGALSGLFDQKQPTPTAPVSMLVPTSGPTEAVPVSLPNLDDLVGVDPDSVLVAQAHGPADGPSAELSRYELPPSSVTLGTFPSGSRISVRCLGPSTLDLDIRSPGSRGPRSGPSIDCDGSTHQETVGSRETQSVGFTLSGDASWRIVVRGQWGPVRLPLVPDPVFETPAGQQELVRLDDITIANAGEPWGVSNLDIQEIGAVPPREGYRVQAWCRGGSAIRYILGDVIDGAIVADTETQVGCRPNGSWTADLGIAQPNGRLVYLAAGPDTRLSFLLTSATPPVALTQSLPGWRISGGLGPEYAFETHGMGFGGAGVGEDHIQVVMACSGTEPIEVFVEDAITQTFEATCTPEGNTTVQTFHVTEQGVGVRYVAPKGTWTALTILVPSS